MSKTQPAISAEGKSQQQLLAVLKETQDKLGHLSREALGEIATSLGLPLCEVYSIATFYSFLSTKPQGRHVIRICKSVPCLLKDPQSIIDSIKQELGIKPGETTSDGGFSFELVNCIGACDKAPAMMIDSDVHGSFTSGEIPRILERYRSLRPSKRDG